MSIKKSVIALDASETASPLEVKDFSQFDLRPEILRAVLEAGFTSPTPIQQQAFPLIQAGNDLIAQAQTGSGKTAAFALPMLNQLKTSEGAQILVLAPTRELAQQVEGEFLRLGKYLRVKTVSIVGGQAGSPQIAAVRQGAHVIVATPGRLLDHLESGRFKNFAPSFVVLDEADEMLDRGFIDDIKKILAFLPEDRQTLLFSATVPAPIVRLAQEALKNPTHLRLNQREAPQKHIRQILYVVKETERSDALIRLLDTEEPEKAVIFCRTRQETEELSQMLNKRGHRVRSLHGELSQNIRSQVLAEVKEGTTRILIATDVASRGIDIADLTHVFNYHTPENGERYIHRIGRTGRAGKTGIAITIATPRELKQHSFYRSVPISKFELGAIPNRRQAEERLNAKLIAEISATAVTKKAQPFSELLADVPAEELKAFVERMYCYFMDNIAISGPEIIGYDVDSIKGLNDNKRNFSMGGGSSYGGNGRGSMSRRPSNGPSRFGSRKPSSGGGYAGGGYAGGSYRSNDRPAAGKAKQQPRQKAR